MTAPQQPGERHREAAREVLGPLAPSFTCQRVAAALAAAEEKGLRVGGAYAARYEALRAGVEALADDLAGKMDGWARMVAGELRALLGAAGDTGSGT